MPFFCFPLFFFGLFTSIGLTSARAALPPQGRLTLPFVLGAAKQTSYVYRSAEADALSIEAALLQARGPLAPRLTLGVRKLDDQTQPSNAFAPNHQVATIYFTGFEQGVALTGTRFTAEIQHGNTALGFPTIPEFQYYETRAVFTARQSLLQGLWKGTDRLRLLSGEAGREAASLAYETSMDDATFEVVSAYYQAWLAQADVRAAENNLKNRNDLLEITRIKANRGTAERPDVLQSDASAKSAKTQLEESVRILGDIWRTLVISLGLPQELLAVDPISIPVDLDSPISAAKARCQGYVAPNGGAKVSLATKLAELNARASEASAQSLKAQSGFDVVVAGSYASNGIDALSRSETWKTAAQRTYPAWSVELSAQIPLGVSATEGDALNAATAAIRSRAFADQQRDQEAVLATNRCLELEQKEEAFVRSEQIFKFQSERLRLEERRFRIGRSALTQVVIASDDRVVAERNLAQREIDRRLAAWRVLAIEGGLVKVASGSQP